MLKRLTLSVVAGALAALGFSVGLLHFGGATATGAAWLLGLAFGVVIFLASWSAVSVEQALRRANHLYAHSIKRGAQSEKTLASGLRKLERATNENQARAQKALKQLERDSSSHKKTLRRIISNTGKMNDILHAAARPYTMTSPHELFPELSKLASSGRTFFVGPWTTEVGYELLYWIPFLRNVFRAHGISAQQVVAVSRGNTKSWYDGLAHGYVEIFDLLGEDGFRSYVKAYEGANGGKKAAIPYGPDEELLSKAAISMGVADPILFTPFRMNRLFRAAWAGRAGAEPILPFLHFSPISSPPLPVGFPDIGSYAAVKYYFSSCFPDTPSNRRYISDSVAALAAEKPVVLLDLPKTLDDHAVARLPDMPNVHSASRFLAARDNLATQTAIVANASSLHCTYGGFSYLGLFTGVDTEATFSVPNYIGAHLDLALKASEAGLTAGLTIKRLPS